MALLRFMIVSPAVATAALLPLYSPPNGTWSRVDYNSPQCYWPNNKAANLTYGGACSSQGGACCPAGWECLDNGLCRYPNKAHHLPDAFNFVIRFACQADRYAGPAPCADLCTGPDDKFDRDNTYQEVKRCANGSWCCNSDGSGDCCGDPNYDGDTFFAMSSPKIVRTMPTTTVKSSTISTTTSSTAKIFTSYGSPTVEATEYAIVSTTTTIRPSGATASHKKSTPSDPANPRAHLLADLINSPDGSWPQADAAFVTPLQSVSLSQYGGSGSHWPLWAIPIAILATAIALSLLSLAVYRLCRRRREAREKDAEYPNPTSSAASPFYATGRSSTAPYTTTQTQPGTAPYGQTQTRTEVQTVPETRTETRPA